jgi:DNA polymerase-3 subunit delta
MKTSVKVSELESVIKKNGAGPLYLVSGEEDYLRDRAVSQIKAIVLQEETGGLAEFNLDVLYGDETDASEILARAGEAPAFASRRVLLLKSADKLPAREGESLLPYLKAPCDSTTLVFVAPKLDGRTKFAQVLKDQAVFVDCSPLPDQQLPAWIRTEAGRLRVRLDEEAVLLLQDMADSGSLYQVQRELEKLAAYISDGRTAGAADVEALRGGEVGISVFDLTAAIGAHNHGRVLRILARNLEAGEAPLRILGSLIWQYRQLWKAKEVLRQGGGESEAARMLRMPPFRVREFLAPFSDAHMSRAFRMFFETDSKCKGGSACAPARVVESLLLNLCGVVNDKPAARQGTAPASKPKAPTQGKTTTIRNVRTIRSVRPPTS